MRLLVVDTSGSADETTLSEFAKHHQPGGEMVLTHAISAVIEMPGKPLRSFDQSAEELQSVMSRGAHQSFQLLLASVQEMDPGRYPRESIPSAAWAAWAVAREVGGPPALEQRTSRIHRHVLE